MYIVKMFLSSATDCFALNACQLSFAVMSMFKNVIDKSQKGKLHIDALL